MEVIGQLHASAVLSPKKEFLLSITYGLGGLLNSMVAVERSEKIYVCAGKEPLISPGHPGLSLVTVMTELTRQHQNMPE